MNNEVLLVHKIFIKALESYKKYDSSELGTEEIILNALKNLSSENLKLYFDERLTPSNENLKLYIEEKKRKEKLS